MKTMKIRVLYVLLFCSFFAACVDQPLGYLEAEAARYDPNYIDIRNAPMFMEENPDKGWTLSDFSTLYDERRYDENWDDNPDWETLYEADWTRYQIDYRENYNRYEQDSIPWVSTAIERVLGTQPIIASIHEVTSPDGGDVAEFKKNTIMYGNGVLVMFKWIPLGTYMVSVKVSNEGNSAIIKDALKVIMRGIVLPPKTDVPPTPEPEPDQD